MKENRHHSCHWAEQRLLRTVCPVCKNTVPSYYFGPTSIDQSAICALLHFWNSKQISDEFEDIKMAASRAKRATRIDTICRLAKLFGVRPRDLIISPCIECYTADLSVEVQHKLEARFPLACGEYGTTGYQSARTATKKQVAMIRQNKNAGTIEFELAIQNSPDFCKLEPEDTVSLQNEIDAAVSLVQN